MVSHRSSHLDSQARGSAVSRTRLDRIGPLLGFHRIIRSAACAVDQDPVNLALVGMQQDGAATAAGIIHRMFARREHGRRLQNDTDCRCGDYFKGDLASGHDTLPTQAGAL
jgi:hypothetical protein